MHPYSVDSCEKRTVPLAIAALSVVATWSFAWLLETLGATLPWWASPPSVWGFYGMFFSWFDSRLWRLRLWKSIGVVKVPYLAGVWKGHVNSSHDEMEQALPITVVIRQKWSSVSVTLESDHSRSRSLSASILKQGPFGTELVYEYLNEPKPGASSAMHTHRGTCRLIVGRDTLDGEYYAGRDRMNFGRLSVTRAS